jgi:hypothetical protein
LLCIPKDSARARSARLRRFTGGGDETHCRKKWFSPQGSEQVLNNCVYAYLSIELYLYIFMSLLSLYI